MHSICLKNIKFEGIWGGSSKDIIENYKRNEHEVTQVVCLQYLTQGLLASDDTSLLSQPTAEVSRVRSVSETRDSHVVILPSALEVIPCRAHEAQFTALVFNYSLEFNLEGYLAPWAGGLIDDG